jgi:hypothetical protein
MGPGDRFIELKEFLRLTKCGCSNCSADITVEDADIISWDINNDPFCLECAEFYSLI